MTYLCSSVKAVILPVFSGMIQAKEEKSLGKLTGNPPMITEIFTLAKPLAPLH